MHAKDRLHANVSTRTHHNYLNRLEHRSLEDHVRTFVEREDRPVIRTSTHPSAQDYGGRRRGVSATSRPGARPRRSAPPPPSASERSEAGSQTDSRRAPMATSCLRKAASLTRAR
jgi:hypothetical protein